MNLSQEKLKGFYENNMIPAEKERALPTLRSLKRPHLAVEKPKEKASLLNGCSITDSDFGTRFNPQVFYGASHHLDSWLNNEQGRFHELRKNYEAFLKKAWLAESFHHFLPFRS